MKRILLLATLAVGAIACDKAFDSNPSAEPVKTAADNTRKNVSDRQGSTVTPTDQMENETDLTITQSIRKAVMNDDTLSVDAKNVKIITMKGVVTLRGPVKSDAEIATITASAERTANVKRVDNQLEVAAN